MHDGGPLNPFTRNLFKVSVVYYVLMLFVVTLEHSPELCFARKEYTAEGKRWLDSIGERAKDSGVKIHGFYLSTIEHTFYFILETDDAKAISEFFSPPFLTHHRARISPVVAPQEAFNLAFVKENL